MMKKESLYNQKSWVLIRKVCGEVWVEGKYYSFCFALNPPWYKKMNVIVSQEGAVNVTYTWYISNVASEVARPRYVVLDVARGGGWVGRWGRKAR